MPYRRCALVSTQSVLAERVDLLEANDEWSGEYASNAFKIIVPLRGHFYARTDDGEALIDNTSVMVSTRDAVYRMRKPVRQTSVVVTVRDEALSEQWMQGRSGSTSAMIDSKCASRIHALASPNDDRLAREEYSLVLASSLARATARTQASTRSASTRMTCALARARDFLIERFCDDICLSDVANAAFISPYQLSRAFKARHGVAVFAYRERLRIAKALACLSTRRDEIADLAFELGYASHSHFTASFRRAVGVTPSAWVARS
ncbi:MAG: helix-turn-helix transcriptional regulator [Casimicrobium sp.]